MVNWQYIAPDMTHVFLPACLFRSTFKSVSGVLSSEQNKELGASFWYTSKWACGMAGTVQKGETMSSWTSRNFIIRCTLLLKYYTTIFSELPHEELMIAFIVTNHDKFYLFVCMVIQWRNWRLFPKLTTNKTHSCLNSGFLCIAIP